ncbi:hypothetical protein Bhz59_00097 [Stenotrophomonas phage vB_SmaS_Bhz59]
MNRLYWIDQKLHLRAVLADCYINTSGETFAVTKVDGPDDQNRITVSYEGDKRLSIYLADLGAMTDPCLFYFGNSDPDGRQGTLVIPTWGNQHAPGADDEDDDGEDEDPRCEAFAEAAMSAGPCPACGEAGPCGCCGNG